MNLSTLLCPPPSHSPGQLSSPSWSPLTSLAYVSVQGLVWYPQLWCSHDFISPVTSRWQCFIEFLPFSSTYNLLVPLFMMSHCLAGRGINVPSTGEHSVVIHRQLSHNIWNGYCLKLLCHFPASIWWMNVNLVLKRYHPCILEMHSV